MKKRAKKRIVGCKNMKVTLTLTNIGNLRLLDSAQQDYTSVALHYGPLTNVKYDRRFHMPLN